MSKAVEYRPKHGATGQAVKGYTVKAPPFVQAPDNAEVGDPIEIEGYPYQIVEVYPTHVVAEPAE